MDRSTPLLLSLVLYVLSESAWAAEQPVGTALKGRLHLAGSIVDSACTIRVGNDTQAVVFNPTTLSGVVSGDSTPTQFLTINISDCITFNAHTITKPEQHFKLILEGAAEGKYFGIQGAAQGIALQIKDKHGNLISPGMLLEHSTLSANTLTLNYSLALVGSGYVLKAGDYHATIKLSIQHF